jgi:hypothetical protein
MQQRYHSDSLMTMAHLPYQGTGLESNAMMDEKSVTIYVVMTYQLHQVLAFFEHEYRDDACPSSNVELILKSALKIMSCRIYHCH